MTSVTAKTLASRIVHQRNDQVMEYVGKLYDKYDSNLIAEAIGHISTTLATIQQRTSPTHVRLYELFELYVGLHEEASTEWSLWSDHLIESLETYNKLVQDAASTLAQIEECADEL